MTTMLDQFLETALWSTSNYNDSADCPDCLDAEYSICDISDAFKVEAEKFITEFMIKAESLFTESELDKSTIAHDLWLTVEGHGAGFWDGDYRNGDEITEVVKALQSYDSYWGDKLNESIDSEGTKL